MKQTIGIRWQPQSCELKFGLLPLTCSKCCYACHLWTWGISHTVYPFIVWPWKYYHQLRSPILNHKCWLIVLTFDTYPPKNVFFKINCIYIYIYIYHPEIFPIQKKKPPGETVKPHHLRWSGMPWASRPENILETAADGRSRCAKGCGCLAHFALEGSDFSDPLMDLVVDFLFVVLFGVIINRTWDLWKWRIDYNYNVYLPIFFSYHI